VSVPFPDGSGFALFLAAAVALLVVPGPAVFYIVARSIDQGRSAGLVSTLGIGAGIRRLLGRDEPVDPAVRERKPLRRLFRQGVVVNILNPKTASSSSPSCRSSSTRRPGWWPPRSPSSA
jgi:threonine/homoserine/homoserine lactone efflux protein